MINNINTAAQRSVSFGKAQPQRKQEKEFDLTNGVHNDAEAVSVIGAAAVGGASAYKFSRSALVEKTGKMLVSFGDDFARHSKQAGVIAFKFGKTGYNVLKETGEVLVKVVPSLLLKFMK